MKRSRPVKCKSIVVSIGDIVEDGYHLSLNNVITFQKHGYSRNVSLVSQLRTCRKSVSISSVIPEVMA